MPAILILGGARSGKSRRAESIALSLCEQPVYIATAPVIEGDAEWLARIEHHRNNRSDRWQLIEKELELIAVLKKRATRNQVVMVDCLTLWLSNLMFADPSKRGRRLTIRDINNTSEQQARAHQDKLTKPRGALGRLEDVACWFAARQGKVNPDQLRMHIAVFAGDHGVVDEGISAYPSVVTGEMVKNFARGGAAINVLARRCGASLSVVDVGVVSDLCSTDGIVHAKVRSGTANVLHEAAMLKSECAAAIEVGRTEARSAIERGANLLIAGDMGIGNTTASSCIICRLAQATAETVVGFGTGVDEAGRQLKIDVVSRALQRIEHVPDAQVLQEVGGLEIAAMAGFYLQAAESGVPVLIDGFIAAAAALTARVIEPAVTDWILASHVSHGHALALKSLRLNALIDFEMRLGEGSGAALIVPLLQSAIALHNEMATFDSAGVTDKDA